MGKIEPVTLLVFLVSPDCYAALPCGAMGLTAHFVIVVFPDQTHLTFSQSVKSDIIDLKHICILCNRGPKLLVYNIMICEVGLKMYVLYNY